MQEQKQCYPVSFSPDIQIQYLIKAKITVYISEPMEVKMRWPQASPLNMLLLFYMDPESVGSRGHCKEAVINLSQPQRHKL